MYSDSRIYLTTIVYVLSVLQEARAVCGPLEVGDSNTCVDMKWCLYKLYKNPMNWADARQICSQQGHDLLRITDAVEHTYLTSFLATSLSIVSPVAFDSTLWLGMQQNAGDDPRWHNDCSTQPAGYNPVPIVAGPNCFMLDISANTYTYADCSASKMFLCKAKSYELSTCFTSVAAMIDATLSTGAFQGMTAAIDCAGKCADPSCVGYRYYPGVSCRLALAGAGLSYTKGSEKYMKDIINTAVIVADQNSVVAEPCFSSAPVAAVPTTTVALEPTTTVAPVPTTTAAQEPTTTAAQEPTTTVGVATSSSMTSSSTSTGLESSGVTSIGIQQTPSTATPQLSNTITTVDLTSAALSSESLTNVYTGTPMSSCYHCFCNSNQMTSLSPEELQSQIETLKKELTVEKKDLSSWKRKLISVPDERVSAKGLGYLGAGMLAVVFGAVVLIDLPRFMNGLKIFYHTMCSHKKVSDVE